jgi:DNA-directed RNA polymerase subunit RPC12/RpoP
VRIKKFTCNSCGAPKVNEYTSPYIVCDYCGSFTDIDFAIGMDYWNSAPAVTLEYQFNKIAFAGKLQTALQNKDRSEYITLQREYWDYYYRTYPAYLPPSIDTGEKYKLYLDVCAESSTEYAFDDSIKEKGSMLNSLQQSLSYNQTPEGTKVVSDSFFKMAEFYISFTKDSFKKFYSDPDYQIMNELLPEKVHLKMKLSMFVQVWLPYLTREDEDKFLIDEGFSLQYTELEKPEGVTGNCEHCKAEIYIPEGSYKVFCESCHRTSKILRTFNCSSCGAQNSVPDNPSKPIDCEYCGVENRLIKAFFG